jgi:predicted outer membrane repeat protein
MQSKENQMKMTTLKLLAAALVVTGIATASAQTAYYAATAQDLQSDLTLVATTGSDPNGYIIFLENDPTKEGGYFKGNFNYNSANGLSLRIEGTATDPKNPNVSNPTNVIDGLGTGRGLNITSSGSVTVSGITFVRSCGNYQIGALRIAAGSGSSIDVNQCQFLSPGTNSGMGLEVASGQTATIESCAFIGKTNSTLGTAAYDSHGISISGIAGTTLIEQCTMSGNYGGYGAYVTAGQFLTVSNNVFQTNSSGGLYFDPSTGSELAGLSVSNNVFYSNHGYAAYIANINSLIFQNNLMEGNSGTFDIYANTLVTAAIGGNTFIGNTGSADVNPGTLNLVGNTFSGNTGSYGGGIFEANQLTVAGNTFNGNTGGSYGGGATFDNNINGTLIVSNNTFSANKTTDGGGGAYVEDSSSGDVHGTVILTGNTFLGNVSSGNYPGGALYVGDYCTNLIIGNTFKNNTSADGGGAIYAGTVGNTVFADNLVVSNIQAGAAATGGGIYVNATTNFYMINNTIFGNYSAGGGGGASFLTGALTILNVFNNIIYGNSCAGSGPDVYLSGTSGNTTFQTNDVDSEDDIAGTWYNLNPSGLVYQDPQFFDPVNGDYHFPESSPCFGKGDASAPAIPATDLDGNPLNSPPDLGCYQFNNTATHPADTVSNATPWAISIAEFNAYSNAWQNGLTWAPINTPIPATYPNPNPIPANYVTRAGYLLMSGGGLEGFYMNDGSDRPTNWKVPPTLTPAFGPPGTSVNVYATGFSSLETVNITYDYSGTNPKQVGTAQADDAGNFNNNNNPFFVPNPPSLLAGIYTVAIIGVASGHVVTASFFQTPLLTLGEYAGLPGDVVSFQVSGYQPSETVNIYYDTTPDGSFSFTPDSNKNFSSFLTIPAASLGFKAGPHTITFTGTMNNYSVTVQFTQQTPGP